MNFGAVSANLRHAALRTLAIIALTGSLGWPSAQAANLTLAWDRSTDPTVIGYKLYFGNASRNYTNWVGSGASTSVTISNLVPGVTYYFAATTYNDSGLESDFSAEASYTPVAPPQNRAPTLNPISDMVVNEGSGSQTVQLSGIGSGSATENQALAVSAFSGNPNLVPNPTISYQSPQSTATLSFTPATGSFGSVLMTVMVDDGGTVSNTVIRTFTITVNPINDPPTLNSINNLVINENSGTQTITLSGIAAGPANENQPVSVTASSSNPTLIPNPTVNYVSPNSTGSLTLRPATNAFGSTTITVMVSDGQTTNGTTSRSFDVTVNQVVVPPNVLTNAIISPNDVFKFVLNPPLANGDRFTYTLDASAPTGARIATKRGISALVWTPTSAYASTTNLITIHFTDNTTPALSTNQAVQVIVLDYLAVRGGSTAVQAGQTATLPIIVVSSDSATNLNFTVSLPNNRFSNPSLTGLLPSVTGTLQTQGTNLLVSIRTSTSQALLGSNVVAQLNLQASATQSSSFVDLPIRNLTGVKPNGSTYVDNYPQAGRVVVIYDVPLLEATSSGPNRVLRLYGKVGTNYQLQGSTNLLSPTAWSTVTTYLQTNVAQTVSADPSRPMIFYRLKQ